MSNGKGSKRRSMKISQEIRQLEPTEQSALLEGEEINKAMQQKSQEFLEAGGEIYLKQDES